jgi:2-polyprenyl-6-methoxyphenol hydroxylase-like FAD-dependent oxidoreductase
VNPDVIVAGAGPTGLMLAGELALGGAQVVVLERLSARTGQSKALNLQPRSAEVLASRGLLDDLLKVTSARLPRPRWRPARTTRSPTRRSPPRWPATG